MRAVALVAHPDDCVIFAWPFIEAHPKFTWEIVYLTYKPHDPRAREISAYWAKKNIHTRFLGFRDTWLDMVNNQISFDTELAQEAVKLISADLILTHNEDGDYGHIHHKFVHTATQELVAPKVYFASTFNYNKQYTVQQPIEVNELPLHREVVEQFTNRNTGLYIVTPEAETLLNNNNENINT
jgi:LmbE family N-acetylglucosaminyl deacetylase